MPTEAIAVPPPNESVLGQLSSQRGINELGPFVRDFPAIAVYVVCYGNGSLTIDIPGVGSFPLDCNADTLAPGIRNTFDVRYVKTVSVKVTGDDSLLWGISVTKLKADN